MKRAVRWGRNLAALLLLGSAEISLSCNEAPAAVASDDEPVIYSSSSTIFVTRSFRTPNKCLVLHGVT